MGKGSHSDEAEVVPHFLQEVIKVPLMVGGDGDHDIQP